MQPNNPLTGGPSLGAIPKYLALTTAILLLAEWVFFRPAVQRLDDSIHWPKASGVVSATGLKVYLHKPNVTPSFTPTVVYTYTANGIPRTNTRIDYSDRRVALPKEAALRWLENNYPTGKPVIVYHDPTDADRAVSVPGAPDWVFICNWSIALTAGCCLASTLLFRRSQTAMRGLGTSRKNFAKAGV